MTCRRHAAVHNVLVRYCVLAGDADYCDKEAFLLNDLAVPLPWIHFAKVGNGLQNLHKPSQTFITSVLFSFSPRRFLFHSDVLF